LTPLDPIRCMQPLRSIYPSKALQALMTLFFFNSQHQTRRDYRRVGPHFERTNISHTIPKSIRRHRTKPCLIRRCSLLIQSLKQTRLRLQRYIDWWRCCQRHGSREIVNQSTRLECPSRWQSHHHHHPQKCSIQSYSSLA
jgi:hypothetical protein